MKFDCEDNGNCRVYYRSERTLYCWQWEGRQGWHFYVCSRDGEPSHHTKVPDLTPMPKQETAIGRELAQYLATASSSS